MAENNQNPYVVPAEQAEKTIPEVPQSLRGVPVPWVDKKAFRDNDFRSAVLRGLDAPKK